MLSMGLTMWISKTPKCCTFSLLFAGDLPELCLAIGQQAKQATLRCSSLYLSCPTNQLMRLESLCTTLCLRLGKN